MTVAPHPRCRPLDQNVTAVRLRKGGLLSLARRDTATPWRAGMHGNAPMPAELVEGDRLSPLQFGSALASGRNLLLPSLCGCDRVRDLVAESRRIFTTPRRWPKLK